ncbi:MULTISPECIES: hypothetical protein [unclassified Knoellia]|uniref:hypothetical protein n=1 Tax=Knoellia altitudinis TaxID=3404795 RepID=UPI0036176E7B
MPARPSRRLIRTSAAASMAALTLVATAGAASANSFERRVYQGKVWYNDGEDRFCVRADEVNIRDRAVIQVTLRPDNTSRGPTISFGDIDTAGAECRSLATAYEDTHYTAIVKSTISFDRDGTSTYETTRIGFYS